MGSINEHLNQHSSQILSAITDVAPEMFYAWQNEVYGWQHPNIITMPLELEYTKQPRFHRGMLQRVLLGH